MSDRAVRYDFRASRIYVDAPLAAGQAVPLDTAQANYLFNVLRHDPGDRVIAFNGRDGEWSSELGARKRPAVVPGEKLRDQPPPGTLTLAFAPLKHARLDYLVQKAVEMGAARLAPVLTRHTQVARINTDRMRANVIEAAQQCGIISLTGVAEPVSLAQAVAGLGEGLAVFCDEAAPDTDPVAALRAAPRGPVTVFIGPEGGFSEDERALLMARPAVVRLPLGPRILRADTAAVAALALVQAVLGDWQPVRTAH